MVLFISALLVAVKTDWYDADDKQTYENKELERFFKKVKKEFIKNLSSPVFAVNIKTGGSARYKDMGYADSAKEWEEKGGELKQFGVENVKFSIRSLS